MKFRYIIFFLLLYISCSNSNKPRGSDSNFLAYYNTFYVSEKSFQEALKIIQENNDEDNKIPEQALVLLQEAIKNALIIEEKFSKTIYLDDAYYILGRASYLMNRITAANYYFNRLISEFPNSDLYDETFIWLGYIDLKIGNIEASKKTLSMISKASNKNKYLLYILSSEIAEHENILTEIIGSYRFALDYADKDQKGYIYKRLLKYAEESYEYYDCIDYLTKIEQLVGTENFEQDLLDKWIEYNLKVQNYDDVLEKLDDLILITIKKNDLANYKIKKIKVYLLQNDIDNAMDDLITFIEQNKDNSYLKNSVSEAYLLLGEIALKKNFLEAESYFQESVDISINSEYGKSSQAYLNSIISYNELVEEIKYEKSLIGIEEEENPFMIPIPDNLNSKNIVDSLSYSIAQLFYYNFNIKDSAIVKFKDIVNKFPLSDYSLKSLIILDIEEPDSSWNKKIEENFPLSFYMIGKNSDDNLESKRNQAWDMLSESYEDAIDMFIELSNNYDDHFSLYTAAYISDYMYFNTDASIRHYNDYLTKYEEKDKSNEVKMRLVEIKGMLSDEISNLDQRINYRKGWFWISDKKNIDSSIYYLSLSSSIGFNRGLKSYTESLKSSIEQYEKNINLFNDVGGDSIRVNKDSLKLHIAHFLYKEINNDSEASTYYKEIVENNSNSNFINSSLASLSLIEPNNNWSNLLFEKVNKDSSAYKILVNNSLKKEQFKSFGSMSSDSLDFLWYKRLYNQYFKEEVEVDSTKIILEPSEDKVKIKNEKNR
ncbi:MAG: hypothetical protein CMD65_00280 [Gammaproteobacteria bacterium]|nr:hypothetical protein [Gammaproteobacteria bacterium]